LEKRDPILESDQIKKGLRLIVFLLITLVAVTSIFIVRDLDISVEKKFFSRETGWFLDQKQPWKFLHQYGTIPGVLLTLGALAGLIFCMAKSRYRSYRKYFLLLVLTAVIGAGFTVNIVMKPYWGRPRPRQTTEFGGQWAYRHPHQIGTPGKGQSFPCGHCTMGFLFVTLFFFRERSRFLSTAGGSFGLVYGFLIGAGRMVQGAHFATDVLWSLGVILLVAIVLHYFALPRFGALVNAPDMTGRQKWLLGIGSTVLAALILLGFLTRRPFYETDFKTLELKPGIKGLIVESNVDFEKEQVKFVEAMSGMVLIHAKGFGWIDISQRITIKSRTEDNVFRITNQVQQMGYFSELNHRIDLFLPDFLDKKIKIEFVKSSE